MGIVYCQGSFDILHHGHINILRRCRKLAGIDGQVIVSLLSDESYTSYRGYAPALPFKDRRIVLENLVYVDQVLQGDNRKTAEEILAVKPDYVVVGSDWAKKDIFAQYKVTPQFFDDNYVTLIYLPYTEGISSTEIKKRICTFS